MKQLVQKMKMEMVFLDIILSFSYHIICDSFKDWYNYRISLRRAFRLNKNLYIKIFEIDMMNKDSLVRERDKRIWIEQKRDQKEEYLKRLGER